MEGRRQWDIRFRGELPLRVKVGSKEVQVDFPRVYSEARDTCIVHLYQFCVIGICVSFPVNVSDVIHGCSSADTNLSLFFSTLDNHAMSHHIDPSKIPTVVNIVLAQHQAEGFSAGEVMLSDVTHQEFLKH